MIGWTSRCSQGLRFIMKVYTSSSFQSELVRTHDSASCLEINAQMPSEIKAISPLVDRLTRMIEDSHCVLGEEPAVGLALREALNNAVLHGNRLDPCKLVQIYCRCELGKGVSIVVKDRGRGFDPSEIPDRSVIGNLDAERGRGILLMRWLMDEVSFEFGFWGTEVHMLKRGKESSRYRSSTLSTGEW